MRATGAAVTIAAMLRALNQTRASVLCERLERARGFAGRTRGLLGRATLEGDAGLLFSRGALEPFMWMHTLGMRFAIDIVFLDRERRVLRIVPELKPWRFSPLVFGAHFALELAAGAVARSHTQCGDHVLINK